ncbi:FkbM family methyltransferase [Phenylobacterium sp.]|uniref:FkbM family methyltransferase n=1 Tax=Phenylobacterium sp. TaxID=1871053 RepID=UPI002E36E2B9|nr:FkbM family methyltransferase [Phenylobacterium sp.]HEX2560984.1 FkbM family methyltransferase [Phenylobacterium sp.]
MFDVTRAYGLTFYFPEGDSAVGGSLKAHGEFARPLLDYLLLAADRPGGAFVDVGANIGTIALPFAVARRRWRVVALEAHRGIAGILSANVVVNGLTNVEVLHAAAGPEAKLAAFPTPPLRLKGNHGVAGFLMTDAPTEPVRMLRLDDIPGDVRVVKVDVEGFEPEVLKGAGRLIRDVKPTWVVEATRSREAPARQVMRIFLEAGYDLYWLFAPFVTPLAPKTPGEIRLGDLNVVAVPPGGDNPWNMTPVRTADDPLPSTPDAHPYIQRYTKEGAAAAR